MTHLREQLRNALQATVSGLPLTQARVFVERAGDRALDASSELPALEIRVEDEVVTPLTIDAPIYERVVQIQIEAVVSAGQQLYRTLDAILADVERAIATSQGLIALCSGGVRLTAVSKTEVSGDGELPVGRQTFSFEAIYITAASDPHIAR
jgi:hypothetical protein